MVSREKADAVAPGRKRRIAGLGGKRAAKPSQAEAGPGPPPYRQATRLLNEFQVAVSSIAIKVVGHNIGCVATFLMILRTALRSEDEVLISSHAMSNALSFPIENNRRYALAFVDMGLLRSEGRRFWLAPGFLERPDIVGVLAQLLDRFQVMLDGFRRSAMPPPQGVRARSARATAAAALDIYLAVFELNEARIAQPGDLYVLGVVTVMNAARITHDPVLSELFAYADTVPPPELRTPVSIRAISLRDGLPYANTWRRVDALAKAGALRSVRGGYVLEDRWMDSEATSALSRERIHHLNRVLAALDKGDIVVARG